MQEKHPGVMENRTEDMQGSSHDRNKVLPEVGLVVRRLRHLRDHPREPVTTPGACLWPLRH